MKKLLPLLLAFALPIAASAADFEGKVTMKMTGPRGAPQELVFSLAKGLSRIDVDLGPDRAAAMIFDPAKQEMTILMPEQRMYMVQSLANPQVEAAAQRAEGTVEKTDEHEKILGYDCVKYVSKSADTTTEIWGTDQLGTFAGLGGGNPMGGFGGRRGGPPAGMAAPGWENAFRGKDFFPLRVISKDTAGKETFRMEATSVEKQAIPASTFTPPADYRNMSDMMKGMGFPGGMPGMPPRGGR
jgi:hypothetical protein